MQPIIQKTRLAFLPVYLLLVFAAYKVSAQNLSPVVKTNRGYVQGLVENNIDVFKGIPYAAPPLGALRFRPPVEHAFWRDTLPAFKFGPIATQLYDKGVVGSEDCLSLNVYTPGTDNKKRAVVVWVHGGSMTSGAGKGEDGHAFADHDGIVTVTINYRLGVFGFMYLSDLDKNYATSANNGLLDCIMALSWIKQNITAFGGDPDRVTLMGESAGAKLISAVMVSAKSNGLFQQYIAESGAVQCIRDTMTAKNERLRILKPMGASGANLPALLTLPADSLIKMQAKAYDGVNGTSFFGPVIDGIVIKNDPYQYANNNSLPHIKALVGTNRSEGALFVAMDSRYKQPDSLLFKSMFGDDYTMVYNSYLQLLKTMPPVDASVQVLTQYMYQMHTYRWAKALAQNGIPVWMYRFDYAAGRLGAAHAAELPYVWNEKELEITDTAKKQLALNIHGAWVAFIKTGNPNIPTLPNWPNYTSDKRQIMLFDTTDKVIGLKEVFDDKDFPSAVFVLKR
jgi:para-nitrobenzyl esterase